MKKLLLLLSIVLISACTKSKQLYAQEVDVKRYHIGAQFAYSRPLLGDKDLYLNLFIGKLRNENISHNLGFNYESRYYQSKLYGVDYFYKIYPFHLYHDIIRFSTTIGLMPFYEKVNAYRKSFNVAGVIFFGGFGPQIKISKSLSIEGIFEFQYSKGKIMNSYKLENPTEWSETARIGSQLNLYILLEIKCALF